MKLVIKKKTLKVISAVVGIAIIAWLSINIVAKNSVKGNPHVLILTSKGEIEVELFKDKAPKTVENFLNLTKKGFYNDILFHRVIPDFMVQTGDPKGDGTGGPGYEIQDEFSNDLKHDKKGMLSMANRGPNTGGSQFFITVAPTPWLDGKHAIFGQVVKGQEIVDNISKAPRGANDRPNEPIKMLKVELI